MNNNEKTYRTIGEITKELGLINKKNGQLQTHTIRYWETQFHQIKPTIRAGKRRYYSANDFNLIKHIKFLLKDQGLTIVGVKKMLNKDKSSSIDPMANIGINKSNLIRKKIIKSKIKKISSIIKEIKKIK